MPTNADTMPLEIALVLLTEFLFGLGYNAVVAFWMKNRLVHVSGTVVIGVTGTLLIAGLFWWDTTMAFWQAVALQMMCFTASGIPMIVGSMKRTVKDQKKRRPWPNAALRVRDDVVMELSTMAREIAEKAKENTLSLKDLPDYVHRLHYVIGILKSV